MDEDRQYYVYTYTDCETEEIVYVGQGCKGRAWFCGYMRGDTKERTLWKEEQLSKGFLPCDWVTVEKKGLTKEEAKTLERSLIEMLSPILNKHFNSNYNFSKVTEQEIEEWRCLREAGHSYSEIAETSNYTTMTIWRALND
jgi:hypothetical protein